MNGLRINPQAQPNANHVCTQNCIPLITPSALDSMDLTAGERDTLLKAILDARDYDMLMEEYQMYDEEYLYDLLSTDTTLMWLGGSNDPEYQAFYDSIQASNTTAFDDIELMLDTGNYEQAAIELAQLVPQNTIEANLKTVYSIYLDTWAQGPEEITGPYYDSLLTIALQLPYAGGPGVYSARVMLGIEPDDYSVAYRMAAEPAEEPLYMRAYPNPAENHIYLRFSKVDVDETARLQVFSLNGVIVHSQVLEEMADQNRLDCSILPSGLYIATLRYANGKIATVKFSVQH
jgi:hypothetical protein